MSQPANKPNRRKRYHQNGKEVSKFQRKQEQIENRPITMPTPECEIIPQQLDRFNKANWKDELPEELNKAVEITARVCEIPDEAPNDQVKLTKPMIRDIAKAMARYSMSLEDAAALVGIDQETINRWMHANASLSKLFSRARARGQKDLASALLCHDQLSERGIIFMLERRHAASFSPRTELHVSGQVNHFHISSEDVKRLQDSLQAYEDRNKITSSQAPQLHDITSPTIVEAQVVTEEKKDNLI